LRSLDQSCVVRRPTSPVHNSPVSRNVTHEIVFLPPILFMKSSARPLFGVAGRLIHLESPGRLVLLSLRLFSRLLQLNEKPDFIFRWGSIDGDRRLRVRPRLRRSLFSDPLQVSWHIFPSRPHGASLWHSGFPMRNLHLASFYLLHRPTVRATVLPPHT